MHTTHTFFLRMKFSWSLALRFPSPRYNGTAVATAYHFDVGIRGLARCKVPAARYWMLGLIPHVDSFAPLSLLFLNHTENMYRLSPSLEIIGRRRPPDTPRKSEALARLLAQLAAQHVVLVCPLRFSTSYNLKAFCAHFRVRCPVQN